MSGRCPGCQGPAEVVDAAPPGETGDIVRCPVCDGTSVKACVARELRRRGYRLTFLPDGVSLVSVDSVAVTLDEDEGSMGTTVRVVVEREQLYLYRYVDEVGEAYRGALRALVDGVDAAGGGRREVPE